MIDIQAGDVVVCVNTRVIECDSFYHTGAGLEKAAVCRVARITRDDCGCPMVLTTSGKAGLIQRWRKIKPATEEFTTQIKAIRPIKQREDA